MSDNRWTESPYGALRGSELARQLVAVDDRNHSLDQRLMDQSNHDRGQLVGASEPLRRPVLQPRDPTRLRAADPGMHRVARHSNFAATSVTVSPSRTTASISQRPRQDSNLRHTV